ncbi:MAG: tannase/feruloyl esterase family alpha/beta hydrolase [Gemmatimonadetes bacterium]|nr:tannase/feruloyl esterase family alpha/beta hydrolase [Gemmatimonadota bacterium]
MHSLILPLLLSVVVASPPAAEVARVTRSAAADCAALANATVPDVRITDAAAVPANPRLPLGPRVAHCRVRGVIGAETRFELLLPDDWNRRFMMGGAGGFAGSPENQAAGSVNDGYATVGTDAGHAGTPINANWALGHPDRIVDYAHRAVHRTAEVAKQLIGAYYGSPPVKSYFFGCSNGGREALMEAQRYPGDFDGIVALAPAADFTATAVRFIATLQALYPTGDFSRPAVTLDNLKLVQAGVLAACDARDGVSDGVLEDPRTCDFALDRLPACPDDVAAASCLTRAQRAAIAAIRAPVVLKGRTVYPGQPWGDEANPAGWPLWITGPNAQLLAGTANRAPTLQAAFGVSLLANMVFGDSAWDYRAYDLSRWEADTRALAAMLDANNPDLSAFKARGGKLILAHGWSDPALNALATINYHDAVLKRDRRAGDYMKLFLLPGVLHCAGGAGCDVVDWFAPIADWVERGQAPTSLVAKKLANAMAPTAPPARTHLLCPYPQRAVFGGTGTGDDAGAFTCKP